MWLCCNVCYWVKVCQKLNYLISILVCRQVNFQKNQDDFLLNVIRSSTSLLMSLGAWYIYLLNNINSHLTFHVLRQSFPIWSQQDVMIWTEGIWRKIFNSFCLNLPLLWSNNKLANFIQINNKTFDNSVLSNANFI